MGMIDHFIEYDGNFFNIEDIEIIHKYTHTERDKKYGTIYIKGEHVIYFPSEKYDEIIHKILACNTLCEIIKK